MKLFSFPRSSIAMLSRDSERFREREWKRKREFILRACVCVFFTIFSPLFSNVRAKNGNFSDLFLALHKASPWFRLTLNSLPIKSHNIEFFAVLWLISLDILYRKICCISFTRMSIDISMLWNVYCFSLHGQPRIFSFLSKYIIKRVWVQVRWKMAYIRLKNYTQNCSWNKYNLLFLVEVIIIAVYYEREKKYTKLRTTNGNEIMK